MVRAIAPLIATIPLAVTLASCVGGGEVAGDGLSASASARSGRTDDLTSASARQDDVEVRLPQTDRPATRDAEPESELATRPEWDEGDDIGPAASIQSALAADAAEHAKRLAAMLSAEAQDPASSPAAAGPGDRARAAAPQRGDTASPRTTSAGPASAEPAAPRAGALPSDPKELAQAIVAGMRSSVRNDSRPVVRALHDATSAIEDPDGAFDVNAYEGLAPDERALVVQFHATCVSLGRELHPAAARPALAPPPAPEAGPSVAIESAATPQPQPSIDAAEEPQGRSLAIPRFDLATKVDGFGRLIPVNDRRFLPGKPTQVVLYVEIDGFDSERDGQSGEWTTSLASKVAIFARHDGTEVWRRDWQAVTDRSPVRRGDFFICEKVTLSEYLTVGTYSMKTSVRDEKTGAIAERSIDFQVVADPSLAVR